MTSLSNAMTVDVEDYFQVQGFAHCIDRSNWDAFPRRVDLNTNRILEQFQSAEVKATFFTLGWVAQRFPALIRRIVADGHELASHGWDHTRADSQDPDGFRSDVGRTKALLEDTGGVSVSGYRAATFSVGARNMWVFPICGRKVTLIVRALTRSGTIFTGCRTHHAHRSGPIRTAWWNCP